MPRASAIVLRARGPSPHVGIAAVGGSGPRNVPQAAAPPFSLPFTRIHTGWEPDRYYVGIAQSVASRLYPLTTFPSSPPFLTWGLGSAYLRLGFQCTHFIMLIFLLSHGFAALSGHLLVVCALLVQPNGNRAMCQPRRPAVSLWLVSPLCFVSFLYVLCLVRVWLLSLYAMRPL